MKFTFVGESEIEPFIALSKKVFSFFYSENIFLVFVHRIWVYTSSPQKLVPSSSIDRYRVSHAVYFIIF